MSVFVYLFAYLLGSIPSAYIVAKMILGIDIRDYGSGNVGSTNALRVIGKKGALIVFGIDVLKGFLAALLGLYIGGPIMGLIAGSIAMLGHIYPFWLGFKGGKGIATGLGALLPIIPHITLFALLIWFVVLLATGYVSLGSVAAILVVELMLIIRGYEWPYIVIVALLALLIIMRHWGNLRRILRREEPRILDGGIREKLMGKIRHFKKEKSK